ncbi:DDE-domain-containing protein, partial [Choiromyces venosus 120613-1]
PNTTSQLQPLDAGIIRTFKAYYRQAFLQLAILRDEEDAIQNPFKISQLEAMELRKEAWSKVLAMAISNCWKHVGLSGKFGPGLPVECPSNPIPTFGPGAEQYRRHTAQRNQHPDKFLLSYTANHEVSELAVVVEREFQKLRIQDPMAVEMFLNPVIETTVTGELSDEEIIGMINHAEQEAKGTGGANSATAGREVGVLVPGSSEFSPVLSTSEALAAARSLIHKLLDETNIPEIGLDAIRALRGLEKIWRIQKLRESTVQQSILSYFTAEENLSV